MTEITTVKTICDGCGEEIDTTQPYIHATNPAEGTPQWLDYHPGHVPTPEQLSDLLIPTPPAPPGGE